MVSFLNAKINIGLNIIGKRDDGYHNLETLFYPIAVKDAVEIVDNNDPSTDVIFSSTGNRVHVHDADNLCVKAYHLLKKEYPQIPPIKMHLHKNIPVGAGMGGGSADASAILLLLNKTFELNISTENLLQYALQLGSDCPFFIINKPCFATGRGENLQQVNIDLSPYKIMIVHPAIHVNTADAFSQLNANNFSPAGELIEQLKLDIYQWKNMVKNDFEVPVFKMYPIISEIKEKFYKEGAIYSAMSGSGSTVFGIFSSQTNCKNIKFPSHYFCQMV